MIVKIRIFFGKTNLFPLFLLCFFFEINVLFNNNNNFYNL
jgi:hypothetical protein